jgi:hypothetical protein
LAQNPAHPIEHERADFGLASGWAFDVAQIEGELDELVAIDRNVDVANGRLGHCAIARCAGVRHNNLKEPDTVADMTVH